MTRAMTGAALRAWRRRLGFTQETAGAAIGRHPRMIGQYEDGTYDIPQIVELACIAVELDTHTPAVAHELRRRLTLED